MSNLASTSIFVEFGATCSVVEFAEIGKSEHNRVPKEVRKIRILEATGASTRVPVCINTVRVEKPTERAIFTQGSASTRAPVCRNTARVDGSAQLKFPFFEGNTVVLINTARVNGPA